MARPGAGARKREKKDKWRMLLLETEKQAELIMNHVAALKAEQAKLRQKADMLAVIVEGLGVVVHCQMHLQDRLHDKNAAGQRLQTMEQQIQQLLGQLHLACSPASSLQPGILPFAGGTVRHYSTTVLINLFQPAWVSKVLSMSDDAIIARLRTLVGKGAIMLLQSRPNIAAAAAAELSNNSAAARAGTSSISNASSWQSPQLQQHIGDASAAELPAGAACGDEMPPPLEYSSLLLSLLLWDESRFWRLQFINLETLQPNYTAPPEVWAAVAVKADFTEEQVAALSSMGNILDSGIDTLLQLVGDAAREALAAVVLQEQQHWQQLPHSRQELLHQQAALVQLQSKQLVRWQLLALQMGIVAMNTLTLRQLILTQVLSYPSPPRLDLIMRAYETLQTQHTSTGEHTADKPQQHEQQQQANASSTRQQKQGQRSET